jgi:hypothetical protein
MGLLEGMDVQMVWKMVGRWFKNAGPALKKSKTFDRSKGRKTADTNSFRKTPGFAVFG